MNTWNMFTMLADNNCDDAFDVEDDNDWNEDSVDILKVKMSVLLLLQWGDDGCFAVQIIQW